MVKLVEDDFKARLKLKIARSHNRKQFQCHSKYKNIRYCIYRMHSCTVQLQLAITSCSCVTGLNKQVLWSKATKCKEFPSRVVKWATLPGFCLFWHQFQPTGATKWNKRENSATEGDSWQWLLVSLSSMLSREQVSRVTMFHTFPRGQFWGAAVARGKERKRFSLFLPFPFLFLYR